MLETRKGAAFEAKRKELEEALYVPEMPEEYNEAWTIWCELNSSRSSNGFGYNPISFAEIHAYAQLTYTLLLPFEIKGIQIIDRAFLKAHNELSKNERANKNANKETTVTRKPPPRRR